jgi:hypothetical protein
MTRTLLLALVVLLSTPAPAAPVPSDDLGVGWKVAFGCALASVAASGAIGVATQAPLQRASPELANILTPRVVVVTTASVGLAIGLTVAIVAHVLNPNDGDA